MLYCGLDVAMKSSYVFISDAQGRKVDSGEVVTDKSSLSDRLRPYVRRGLSVALEAGNQTAWIHDHLIELGAQVTVVNPTKVKLIAESRRKTDKIDAKILCELMRMNGLPHPVHMPQPKIRALRGLLAARRQLVSARTKLCNVVRGMMRQEGVTLPARALSCAKGWKELLAKGFTQPHVAVIVSAYFEPFRKLTESIRELDQQLAEYERTDERAARLQTIPKVGRIASLTLLAAVDDVKRFPSSRKLAGYSGLAPTVRSSGDRTEYGPISREGRSELRAVWVQIAHLVAIDRRKESQRLRSWFNKVARRRGRKTAIVALARRLLVIAYHLLKENTVYDASRLKRKAAA